MHKSEMLDNTRVTKEKNDSEKKSDLNFDTLPIKFSNPGCIHN